MSTVPHHLAHLVDDAAIFPPGNAPLPDAVKTHREHRRSAYADLIGPFVVGDTHLPDLLDVLRTAPGDPLAVSVVVSGGAGAIEPAVRWAVRADEVDLRMVEVALRDETDLAHNARRMVAMLDNLRAAGDLAEEVAPYVEMPPLHGRDPGPSWLDAADEIAAAGLSLKFRTGGAAAEAFPTAADLAACIGAALDREAPFKCTAGLHRAVRHRDERGLEHHGFLNVLLGTRASLDGAPRADVAATLDEADAERVADAVTELGPDAVASARRWFTSFGSCSVSEPLDDLLSWELI